MLSTRHRLSFSFGSFVTAPFATVPGLLLLPYLTDTMAVPAAAAGAIVLVPKAWDVLFNPIAGRISDRALRRQGSRRPVLLLGGCGVALLFMGLFAHPGLGSVAADAGYVVVVFFVAATAYAFFQVPYNALPAEITDAYDERTRMSAWRIAMLALAILVSGAGAPAIANGIGGVAGYRLMSVAVAALMLTGALVVYFGLRDAPVGTRRDLTPRIRELAATMRGWRPFQWLLAVYVVQSVGVGTLLAGVVYAARHVLGDPGLQTFLFAGFVGPAMLVMPLWSRLGRRGGKLVGFRVASGLFGGALLVLSASTILPTPVVFGFVALAGVGYAGVQVFPLAILPDLIAVEERRTGATRAGVAAGLWTAAETLGLALGPGLFGLVLAVGGYVSTMEQATVAQPESAITAIVLGFSSIPGVLILLGIPLLRRSVLPAPGTLG
ncbi:Na+/melibiose symporter-like transporter [Amycolatopsis cihanbeyliensis]|uniref:Na+/melibiose symporter-like transporter n=1 Tax=Amycolatopsis cihanbeyliensis TaxID=1128664 RepID=A0A542DCN0_AMYCI|nr:Na+/melibiose symporter-like transporter [Amycolatopsis cihanbeyliensis]